jgi:hypothetical protein
MHQEKRRYQVAALLYFQELERMQDLVAILAAQGLDDGFQSMNVGTIETLGRIDLSRQKSLAEGCDVVATGNEGLGRPQHDQRKPEPAGMDRRNPAQRDRQQEDRCHALGESLDQYVNVRFDSGPHLR